MATLAATRFNEQMSSYLQALRQRGKPFKVAMVACMHGKLLCILNAMLRDGRPYNPQLKPKNGIDWEHICSRKGALRDPA